ncbi:two-component system sensor histidine kinase DesK [Micromonospora pisi]|uniref:Two-component system sensor histidine kinase DesK n=1 Tax=Micromonospora pisi TaxID=589240 RepID=A0A495JKS0_9ACTN|nr:sensor histidine kinase [Micromonospora pisi]RKR89255.1 two-component system sensor histidine kinase DesK [Micromonospora pisi]
MTSPDHSAWWPGRRSRRDFGWAVGGIWLVYLSHPISTAWQHPPGFARDLAVGALLGFGLCYVLIFALMVRARHRRRALGAVPTWGHLGDRLSWALLGLLFGLSLLAIPGVGADWLVTLVYLSTAAVMLLPLRAALVFVGVMALVAAVTPFAVPGWRGQSDLVFAVLLAAFATFGVTRLAERNADLLAAQREIHRLAVAGERSRTARDLHDILGHSLTVVAVKAELAGRLLEVDPGRAAVEVADVERLAREALADVRSTVGAYREVTLATELAGARTALDAAGIEADLPAAAVGLPEARSELFGWAVREGVTNVVRHSGARRCTVRVGHDMVEVLDDGRGPEEGQPDRVPVDGSDRPVGGHGLLGLRERAEQAGGRVTVGRGPGGRGFRLRVELDRRAG